MNKYILINIALIIVMPSAARCYEVNVHREMTKKAIAASSIEYYLNNNLNVSLDDTYKNGILDNLKGRMWLENGSDWEDNSFDGISLVGRYLNHFFDPTTGMGLHDVFMGKPSKQWGYLDLGNDFSWRWARSKYYMALADSDPNLRAKAFAHVFRSLGQIMHLAHDKAVPAHVRNDAHYPYTNYFAQQRDMYEKYTDKNADDMIYDGYPPVDNQTFNQFQSFWINSGKGLAEFTNRNFVSRNTNIDDHKYALPSGTSVSIIESYLIPILGINVEVKYMVGTITDLYKSTSSQISHLAAFSYLDYESEHFLTPPVPTYSLDERVHADYARFLIPRAVGYSAGLLNYFFRGDINLELSTSDPSKFVIKNDSDEDMTGKFEIYYDNSNGKRTLLLGLDIMTINAHSESMMLTMDEIKNPGTYMLVFRGKMGNEEDAVVGRVVKFAPLTISAPDRCLYGLIDGARLPQQFNKIKAKVKSSFTPEQAVQSGTLWAIAKYKRRMDYQPDLSTDPPSPGVIDPVFAYSTSAPISITAAHLAAMNNTKEFPFNFAGSPIPAGITDLYLKVVFRGTNGTSQDIIAMGWKDLGEPMHHVYWNATDAFYIEGKMYDKNTIEASQYLLDRARQAELVGFPYGPLELDTDIAYCPSTDGVSTYHVEYAALPAGTFGRVITITEADQPEFDVAIHRKSTNPPEEMSSLFTSPTVVNQTNQNGVLQIFPVFSFRGISSHAGSAFVNCYVMCPENILTLPWPNAPMRMTPKPATFIEK